MCSENYILHGWEEKYFGFIAKQISDAEHCLAEFKKLCENMQIVLWGANSHGKTLNKLFTDIGLTVTAYIDKNADAICKLDNINVYTPEWLTSTCQHNNILLIASVNAKNYESIKQDAERMQIPYYLHDGFTMHLPVQSSFCLLKSQKDKLTVESCSGCTRLNHTCHILRNNIIKHKNGKVNENGADITLIGCILGTICSLNCMHCVEHVPYISKDNKRFISKEVIISDIKKLASASRFVTIVDFVGGEPFLHPELAEIVAEVGKIENIGNVNVFTNGTVMPKDELLKQLTNDYVTVDLSNYSLNLTQPQKESISRTEKALADAGVSVFQAKNFTWSDTRSFEAVDDSEEHLSQRFRNCILKDCYRLYDGKLFRCLHHYAGYVTGNLTEDDSVVDIRNTSREQLINDLGKFINTPYIDACRYCMLPYNAGTVSSGVQLVNV